MEEGPKEAMEDLPFIPIFDYMPPLPLPSPFRLLPYRYFHPSLLLRVSPLLHLRHPISPQFPPLSALLIQRYPAVESANRQHRGRSSSMSEMLHLFSSCHSIQKELTPPLVKPHFQPRFFIFFLPVSTCSIRSSHNPTVTDIIGDTVSYLTIHRFIHNAVECTSIHFV
ncbi:hypothetical protein PMAYCL1PPCAC_29807 [Pristionchus mayeri]|uniref:Uncharacterized protein n=1 Tax=Pristionchus mayeri TaxID=1317129 RepID=A0AAN5DBN9_9BILA|nr:hypothetical protein PMAYCL1PPCAC_29807 [Pristionchus mayeri]